MLNFCQKIFSSNGYYENGCVICTNTFNNYTAAGLSVPNDFYCGSSRNFNWPLDSSSPDMNTTNLLTANNTNSSINNSSFISYTICAVQDFSCKSNTVNFDETFTSFILGLNSPDSFRVNLNISNVNIISNVTNIVTNSELNIDFSFLLQNAPDISNLTLTNITAFNNGTFSWVAQNTKDKLNCFWAITSIFMTVPGSDIIRQCSGLNYCGSHKLNRQSITVTQKILTAFQGKNYAIYYTCLYDLPTAKNSSEVIYKGGFLVNTK